MPPFVPGFATFGSNPSLLISSVNRRFQERKVREKASVVAPFCFIDMVGRGAEEGADGGPSRGGLATMRSMDGYYPMTVIAYKDQPKGDTEKRDFSEGGVAEIGPVRAVRLDGPSILRPERPGYDPYALIEQGVQRMGVWGLRLWDRLVSRLFNANPNSFDLVPFFGANHPVDPVDPLNTDTYTNILTNTDLDEAGYGAAFELLDEMRALNGLTLANEAMEKPWVVVPSKPMLIKALRLFGFSGNQIAQVFGANTAAAGVTTVLADDAVVIKLPYLVTLAGEGLTGGAKAAAIAKAKKTYYVISDAGYPPVIVREEVTPTIRLTTQNDWPSHERDAILAYAKAYVAAAPADPRSIIQVVG